VEARRVASIWGSYIFRHSAHRWRQGKSVLRAGLFLPPGRFPVLISVRGCVDLRAIVRLEGLGKLKTKSTSFGTRTGDLPACSIVPQPTTLPRAPLPLKHFNFYTVKGKVDSCLGTTIGSSGYHLCPLAGWVNIKLSSNTPHHEVTKLVE
jgi:hypothetical protein